MLTGFASFCSWLIVDPDDPQRSAEIEASGVITRMARMNDACRKAGIAVFYGQADHRPDRRDFAPHVVDKGYRTQPGGEQPFRTSPPPVVAHSTGADIIPELAAQPGDYVVKKHRWSTFFQTHLELSLRTAGIDTIMLAGGATEVGIAATAYSARDLDYNQIILKDVCTSMVPIVNEVFMEHIFPIFARVMTVDEAIAAIQKA